MTHSVTANWFKHLLIPALILSAIGSLTHPARAQIVSTSSLTASDGAANDGLGRSVSVSGSYLAVSAPNKTINGNSYQGAVYIYTRSGSGWAQQAEITAADGEATDQFGWSVSLSGTTLIVGAPAKNVNANGAQGVVYIYTRSGSSWTQQAEITSADGGSTDLFGFSVSVSGANLAIGAPNHNVNGNPSQGSVYIFAHSGSSWTQKAEITSADGAAYDDFGFSVSLAGTSLAVGAAGRAVNGVIQQGATYVYLHSGTNWTQQAELTIADGGASDLFGHSVCLSGNILAIGAPGHSVNGNSSQGAAYVYIRSGTTWTQQAELTAADGAAGDYFGLSASFSGTTLAVGVPFHTVGSNTNQGAVYTYLHSGPNWVLQQELTELEGAAGDTFGYSVSLNGNVLAAGAFSETVNGNTDQGAATVFVTGSAALTATGGAANNYMGSSVSIYGSTLAAGAPGTKISGKAYQGAVFVYSRTGTTWTQQAELTAADGESGDEFGTSVSVNGNTLVVGTPYHTVNGIESGAVYVYTLSGTTWTLQAELTASDAAGGDNFGHAVSINASTLAIGASYKTVGAHTHEGVVYIFNRSGTSWAQKTEIISTDGAGYDEFGYSVSLTSTSLAVGAPFHEVGSTLGQGAAYVYIRSGSAWNLSGELTASDGGYDDYFGWSVGLESASPNQTLLVGAPYHTVGETSYQQGAVYSYYGFINSDGRPSWAETAELIAPDGVSGDYFGLSLSLNGSSLIVGAPYKAIDGNLEQGAAYTYAETGSGYGTGWNNLSELTAKDGKTDDVFGYSVCVIGTLYGIGAPEHKVKSYSDQGVVYTLP